jgi:hypothetical protein
LRGLEARATYKVESHPLVSESAKYACNIGSIGLNYYLAGKNPALVLLGR